MEHNIPSRQRDGDQSFKTLLKIQKDKGNIKKGGGCPLLVHVIGEDDSENHLPIMFTAALALLRMPPFRGTKPRLGAWF